MTTPIFVAVESRNNHYRAHSTARAAIVILGGECPDNRAFLHARFELGEDVLKPYKETLHRWLSADVLRNQDTSVVKAKPVISGYKKAVGEPAGLAELMVFDCECAADFCSDVGYQESSYFNSLVRMFEAALKIIAHYRIATAIPGSPGSMTYALPVTTSATRSAMDDLLAEYVGNDPDALCGVHKFSAIFLTDSNLLNPPESRTPTQPVLG